MYYVIHLQQRLAQRGLIKKAFEENTAVIADTAAHGTLFTCFTGTKVQIQTQLEGVLQMIWEAVTDACGDTLFATDAVPNLLLRCRRLGGSDRR